MNKNGAKMEETQGKALVDAALANKVKHFVYTSVDRNGDRSIDNPTPVPHFISKHNIEKHLISQTSSASAVAAMRWTILRPVAFMDNVQPGFFGKFMSTAIRDVVSPRTLQMIDTEDVGFFAALAFTKPDEYAGRSLSLAGDSLTWEQYDAVFRRKTGSPAPTTYAFVAKFMLWMLSHEMGSMFKWFHDEGFGADIEALRKIHPGMKTFEDYLEGSPYVRK
jgi:nucleoside-diphosphate-sugar epimerase